MSKRKPIIITDARPTRSGSIDLIPKTPTPFGITSATAGDALFEQQVRGGTAIAALRRSHRTQPSHSARRGTRRSGLCSNVSKYTSTKHATVGHTAMLLPCGSTPTDTRKVGGCRFRPRSSLSDQADHIARLAALSAWIYRCVVARDECPASSWMSRREQPASVIFLGVAVMNVRLPEWDEAPSMPISRKPVRNQTAMAFALLAVCALAVDHGKVRSHLSPERPSGLPALRVAHYGGGLCARHLHLSMPCWAAKRHR
jgi:hypothetical protein